MKYVYELFPFTALVVFKVVLSICAYHFCYSTTMDPNPNVSISTAKAPYCDLPVASGRLFESKAKKGLTFEQIGNAINKDEVWVAALFYGQAKATDDELRDLSKVLGIRQEELTAELGAHWYPNRGIGPIPPTDPVIYRLYEGVLVYGHALKAIIHEKFGDGIMSMIDCKVHVEKKPDPKGDRVLLTFDGKFLPYAKW